ncbi:MAG TPA: argininosuccinate lyase [Candidatus Baltobacteraceae bacterium]|nr:argininosuccinate lyase [Candidatus Baltobacteraceae bacterium]
MSITVHTPAGDPLQWGGRFSSEPDADLLAFGSSLEEDLLLAPFDVRCSQAHVRALADGKVLPKETTDALERALDAVEREIGDGSFFAYARNARAEDVHGAIDSRVRELAPQAGESLHTGRSRNDQIATTILLYARDRADAGAVLSRRIARAAIARARTALSERTVLAATTHWQPAQPILLAFWLGAFAENFVRAARRFERVAQDAAELCPLGSGACSGSTLPLARDSSAAFLGFTAPSRNALDAIGDRDVALDLLHAVTRALIGASRVSEEAIIWCTPAFGIARLDDSASTGSSLMPQKHNPDPFELVRANAATALGSLSGALASIKGLALSYHKDLQETKAIVLRATERGLGALRAFERTFEALHFKPEVMAARAEEGYVVATDLADALIARGISARRAHHLVGSAVARAEQAGRNLNRADLAQLATDAQLDPFEAPLDARASIEAKRTSGSTSPAAVAQALDQLEAILEAKPKGVNQ